MRKLILKMSMSIDGFVGGPEGEAEWVFRSTDEAVVDWTMARLGEAGLHIMGSRTFRDMQAWWPRSDEPYAQPMNTIPKAYFSRGRIRSGATTKALEDVRRLNLHRLKEQSASHTETWDRARRLTGDLAAEISALKAEEGKPILAHAGASLARSLIATGLIDEYQLLIHPVVLGRGLPIFSELPMPLDLRLVESTRFPSGAIANFYRTA